MGKDREWFLEMMKKTGMNREQFSKATYIDEASIELIERGICPPCLTYLANAAIVAGVSCPDFANKYGEMATEQAALVFIQNEEILKEK